jgi:hypothetical protein
VTTRAVPAAYEPNVRHNREYRRLQAVDSWGKWEGGVGVMTSPRGLVCRQLQTVQLSTRRGKGGREVGKGLMGRRKRLFTVFVDHNVKSTVSHVIQSC